MTKNRFRTINIKSWSQYVDLVSAPPFDTWAFRGQASASWPVESSVTRYLRGHRVHPNNWLYQENRSIEKFQEKAHHFLQHVPDEGDTFRWLALMQHHGAPTRLVDFTWSPYVAAFFALESATGDSAVWAINGAEISYSEKQTADNELLDPRRYDPRRPDALGESYLYPGRGVVTDRYERFVWVGEPRQMNERLIAQTGTFAIPGTIGEPIEGILGNYQDAEGIITKLVLKRAVRDKAIRDLRRMNVSHATLFPGLDGLARSMAYELETHWAYNPKQAKKLF